MTKEFPILKTTWASREIAKGKIWVREGSWIVKRDFGKKKKVKRENIDAESSRIVIMDLTVAIPYIYI